MENNNHQQRAEPKIRQRQTEQRKQQSAADRSSCRGRRAARIARGNEIKIAAIMAHKRQLQSRRQTRADDCADARLFIKRTAEIAGGEIESERFDIASSSGWFKPKRSAQFLLYRRALAVSPSMTSTGSPGIR